MNSEQELNALPEGNVQFVQYKKPVLKAGVYDISINHEIRIQENQDKPQDRLSVTKKFAVRGERFFLDDVLIHSTFPPENSVGNFSQCLPHIVLKNATLPWERSASKQKDAPWLALLVLYEDELEQVHTSEAKLKDLNAARDWLDYASGENDDDSCIVLEVPEALLQKIIPSINDLQWLCHVRSVSNQRTEEGEQQPHSDYAIVMSNRLPQSDIDDDHQARKNSVHLVSLESYYNDESVEGSRNRYQSDEGNIQLISLKSWEFTCTETRLDFVAEMEKLSTGVLRAVAEDKMSVQEQIYARGYTLLRHQMRQGDKTLSLYRGPLLPAPLPLTVERSISCADEALRFYQDWGLFDVSYAAAWQLGRLLAIDNKEFAEALYRWKRDKRFKDLAGQSRKESEQMFGAIQAPLLAETTVDEQADDFVEVNRWLADLKTLSGVPIHYLVADMDNMLPEASLRFFHMDMNWIISLIDGALSLGRATNLDLQLDKVSRTDIDRQVDQSVRKIRKKPDTGTPIQDDQQSINVLTGVLLRSNINIYWPGLEVEAYDDAGDGLTLIRMIRLEENILLCLFEGEIARIDFRPPAEGLHYHIEQGPDGLKIRNPHTGIQTEPVKIENFIKDVSNVIDISYLAEKIRTQFAPKSDESFTSAHFSLAMISESKQVSFLHNKPQTDGA